MIRMFSELGIQIDNILLKSKFDDFDSNILIQLLNEFSCKLKLNSSNEIDYGRYLAYKSENCNIQVDIFSQEYKGQIHNHNTWGAIAIVNGNFILKDYVETLGELTQIRNTHTSKGLVSFFPKKSDIHSLESLKGLQGVSIHVYGKDFDIDNGMRFNSATKSWENYQRSYLKDFKEIESYFQIMSK